LDEKPLCRFAASPLKGAIILWYLLKLLLNYVDFSTLGGNKKGAKEFQDFLKKAFNFSAAKKKPVSQRAS
jgi:hypothetical protein